MRLHGSKPPLSVVTEVEAKAHQAAYKVAKTRAYLSFWTFMRRRKARDHTCRVQQV
jgi:hypothetical protein